MQNWKNRKTYRRIKNPDGSYTYLIKVEGKYVPVNEDIYTTYAQSEEQLEYIERKFKRNRVLQDATGRKVVDENGQPIILPEREVSLDKLMAEDWDYPSSAPSPEDIIFKEVEIAALHRSLDFLDTDERTLMLPPCGDREKVIKNFPYQPLGTVYRPKRKRAGGSAKKVIKFKRRSEKQPVLRLFFYRHFLKINFQKSLTIGQI